MMPGHEDREDALEQGARYTYYTRRNDARSRRPGRLDGTGTGGVCLAVPQ